MTHNCSVAVIGAGCAGLTAALYLARAELAPIVFAGSLTNKGGLLVKTSIVENYPGFPDGILGYDLINNMERQAVKQGAIIRDTTVISLKRVDGTFHLSDDSGYHLVAKAVIIATGSTPVKLGLPNEEKFWSKGISSCAVCDGALYRKKKIIVVGGGDTAMEEALFLTKFSDVTLIHRRDTFRASKIMLSRVIANDRITIIKNSIIEELLGHETLERVKIRNLITDEVTELPVNGLFYGLGLKPNVDLCKDLISLDADGYALKPEIPGLFVAGDVSDKIYKQAIVACGEGCKAALDANNYLQHV